MSESAMVCASEGMTSAHPNFQMNFKVITIAAALGATILATAPAHAFNFGGLIKAVGGAAGVAPITNVVGEVVQQEEIRKTNQMMRDNAAKQAATEEAIEAEVERRLAARLTQSNSQPNASHTTINSGDSIIQYITPEMSKVAAHNKCTTSSSTDAAYNFCVKNYLKGVEAAKKIDSTGQMSIEDLMHMCSFLN